MKSLTVFTIDTINNKNFDNLLDNNLLIYHTKNDKIFCFSTTNNNNTNYIINIITNEQFIALRQKLMYLYYNINQLKLFYTRIKYLSTLEIESKLLTYVTKYNINLNNILKENFHSYSNTIQENYTHFNMDDNQYLELYIISFAYTFFIYNITFDCREKNVLIKMRSKGLYKNIYSIDYETYNGIIIRLKQYCTLDTLNKNSQWGNMLIQYGIDRIYCRISTHPTIFGEKISIRILSNKLKTLDNLNILDNEKKILNSNVLNNGIILCCGMTGTGKTTLIHCLMNIMGNLGFHMLSIEDPVEYIMENISQSNSNNYEEILKSALRQDIDGIFLGEIRDNKSAKTLFDIASTGHRVLSTIHVNSIKDIFNRWPSLNYLISDFKKNINMIIFPKIYNKNNISYLLLEIYNYKEELISNTFIQQIENLN